MKRLIISVISIALMAFITLRTNYGSDVKEAYVTAQSGLRIDFLPEKMISVQKHNNSYRIYYSCMCDEEIITIDTNNNSLNVYSICQEDQLDHNPERYRCTITATERKGEDTLLIISNCVLGFGDKGTYQVEFEFSRDGEVIHLRVLSDGPVRGTGDYIDLRKKRRYPVIHQDCADFDG